MSSKQQYRSPLTRAIVRLIEMTVEGKDAEGNPAEGKTGANIVIKIAWKSIKPQFPMMLYSLDNSPAALQAIQDEMLKVTQENLLKEKGFGYLAWVCPGKAGCADSIEKLIPEVKDALVLEIKSSDRVCIAGLTGTGKTTLTRYLASLAAPNILIIDPLKQYTEFPDKLRYLPKSITPEEMEARAKWMWSLSNMTLIVEEAEQFMPQNRPMGYYTKGLISMGRNWGAGVWGSTRRIQNLNKDFFDFCQHIFFYRCGLTSMGYISRLIGREYILPAKEQFYNKTGYTITTLPQFHCLHFNLTDETADVITLETGARPHIKFLAKSQAPRVKPRK